MEWRGRRESSNIEDRRGGGMGRPAGIGGIGLVVVLLVGIFFGVDLTPLLGPGGGPVDDGERAVGAERHRRRAGAVRRGGARRRPRTSGAALRGGRACSISEPKLVLFTGQTPSACGFAQSAMGPFYCPNDQTVYLDMDFFRVMEQQLGSRGEFAKAYVIAHEVGHHVQDELGRPGAGQRARGRGRASGSRTRCRCGSSCRPTATPGSGRTLRRAAFKLTDDDIRSALDTAARIGDDALQQASQGRVVPDSFTHGTSEQRQTWFYRGFQSGDDDQCDTFSGRHLSGGGGQPAHGPKQRTRADARRGTARATPSRPRRSGSGREAEAGRAPAAGRPSPATIAEGADRPAGKAFADAERPPHLGVAGAGVLAGVPGDRRRRGPAGQRAGGRDRRRARGGAGAGVRHPGACARRLAGARRGVASGPAGRGRRGLFAGSLSR